MERLDPLSIKYFKTVIDPKSIKKDTSTEIQANCPLCNDKKHRLHLYRPKGFSQDTVHCFNAGCVLEKHHTMSQFLKYIDFKLYDNYIKEFKNNQFEKIKSGDTNISDIINRIEKITNRKTDTKVLPLDKFFVKCKDNPDCVKYVQQRKLQPKDDWYYSENEYFSYNNKNVYLKNYLIIPVYYGGYGGFYSRSIKEKSFSTFLLDVPKFWISENTDYENIQLVTEGIFDALSTDFEVVGSMIGADIPQEVLNKLNSDCIIAFDNDKTGITKAKKYAGIKQKIKIFVPPSDWKYKDFNEALQGGVKKEEITEMIKKNSYENLEAQVRLSLL